MRRHTTISMTGASLLIIGGALLYAGPLDPPDGPITSTYKTLTEVEPRIAINDVNTPGDAYNVYVVTQPGSYYLTADVVGGGGKSGIDIRASNVTVDLNGFTVDGASGSGDNGIRNSGGNGYITVRNGRVRNWQHDGINLRRATSSNFLVESVEAAFNGGQGITCESRSVVRGCVATNNSAEGITCNEYCVVEQCQSWNNGSNGIKVYRGSAVRDCVVHGNGMGIVLADQGCTVADCLVYNNSLQGIYAGGECRIAGCEVDRNWGSGIEVGSSSLVVGNSVTFNGNEAPEAGILVKGSDCRVEDNNVTSNFCGIRADFAGSLIIRNSASGNTTNYSIAGGNFCGTIVTSEAAMNSAANANVNISY